MKISIIHAKLYLHEVQNPIKPGSKKPFFFFKDFYPPIKFVFSLLLPRSHLLSSLFYVKLSICIIYLVTPHDTLTSKFFTGLFSLLQLYHFIRYYYCIKKWCIIHVIYGKTYQLLYYRKKSNLLSNK